MEATIRPPRTIAPVLGAAALLLAACTPAAEQTAEPPAPSASGSEADPAEPATPAPGESDGPGATKGGDGSPIVLAPLSQADIAAAELPAELGCAFSTDAGSILVAKGYVQGEEPARGVVKIGDYVEPLVARGEGFEAMSENGEFVGRGLTLDAETTGAQIIMFESSKFPAELTVMRADGAERVIAGEWTCGP